MKAKRNKSPSISPSLGKVKVSSSVNLDNEEIESGVRRARKWTWFDGKDPKKMPELEVIDIPDDDLGDIKIIACGRLVRIHIRLPRKNPQHPRRQRDTMLELSRKASENSFLGFQMDHPLDRLHIILDPDVQKAMRQRFWVESTAPEIEMNKLAALAGGKQGKMQDYPDLEVKVVGVMTAVVYFAEKEGDGPSYYIHKMAEISHEPPILACDDLGRLWIIGGSYTSPDPGITN